MTSSWWNRSTVIRAIIVLVVLAARTGTWRSWPAMTSPVSASTTIHSRAVMAPGGVCPTTLGGGVVGAVVVGAVVAGAPGAVVVVVGSCAGAAGVAPAGASPPA